MQLGLIVLDGKVVVGSRRVAANYDKEHKDVLRAIRTILEQVPEAQRNFAQSSYTNEQGREMPEYVMDRQGFSMLVMGFTGEQARRFTYKYTQAFEEMAAQLTAPRTSLEVLQQTVNQLVEQERLLQAQAVHIQKLEHRVDSLDGIAIEGDKRQRLNAMVRKYAFDNGYNFSKAWRDFISAFNNAYRVNLTARIRNANSKSTPDYLERAGMLDDALRVADKMLNISEVS